MVDAGGSPESADLADALDSLGNPPVVTLDQVATASMMNPMFMGWLREPRNARAIPHRFEDVGYVPVRNPDSKSDGRWKVAGRRTTIYAKKELTERDRIIAAADLSRKNSVPPPPSVPAPPPPPAP